MATVGFHLIVRDVADRLPACLDSIKGHVDEIVIVDTGSTDNTIEVAKRYTDKVVQFTGCNHPETGRINDFAMARNKSLSLSTTDWVGWIDSDDIFAGGENIRNLINTAITSRANAIWTEYRYAFDHHGNCTCTHWRERFVQRSTGYAWRGFVHEVMIPPPNSQVVILRTDNIKDCPTFYVKHQRQNYPPPVSHVPTRNIDILEYHLKGKDLRKCDPRDVYYYGNELVGMGRLDEAKAAYEAYLDTTTWNDEKYKANHEIADIYRRQGKYDEAIQQDLKGLLVADYPDGYFGIAECYYHKKDWNQVIRWTEMGFTKKWPQDTIMVRNPLDYTYKPNVYYSIALGSVGRIHEALKASRDGLAVAPDDPHLSFNSKLYQDRVDEMKLKDAVDLVLTQPQLPDITKNLIRLSVGATITKEAFAGDPSKIPDAHLQYMIMSLFKHLMNHDEVQKAEKLLETIPWTIEDEPLFERMRALVAENLDHIHHPQRYESYHQNDWGVGAALMSQTIEPYFMQWPRLNHVLTEIKKMQDKLGRPLRILDAACMDGWVANRLAKLGHDVTGVDINRTAIEFARREATEFNTGAKFVVGDIQSSDLGEFDMVVCLETYEHVENPGKLVFDLSELLNPGGKIVMSSPRGSWMVGETPVYRGDRWNSRGIRGHVRAPTVYSIHKEIGQYGLQVENAREEAPLRPDVPGQANLLWTVSLVKEDNRKTVWFYTGQAPEKWDGNSIDKGGIGGSETMAINMAEGLAKKGYSVTIYGDCNPTIVNGVLYLPWQKFAGGTCDVFIASRRPDVIDEEINAKLKLLWVHDIHCGGLMNYYRSLKFDRIMCLSKWHRDFFLQSYPYIDPDEVIITRNGINIERFTQKVERNTKKVIYASSPDRGLERLLDMWPEIKKKVPDAELHTYYGFINWKAMGDPGQAEAIERIKKKMTDTGAIDHGRISQIELAKEFLSAGVWAYPTHFPETSCITAMEAQAGGCTPVVRGFAALNETVASGAILDGDDVDSTFFREKFIHRLVQELKGEGSGQGSRNEMMQYAASHFNLPDLVEDWHKLFQSVIQEKVHQPIHGYMTSEDWVR